MTRKMIMALSAAFACRHHRGLEKTSGGYATTDRLTPEIYSHSTVRALRDRGLLEVWGGSGCSMVVHITERGERILMEWSDAKVRS